MNKNTMPSKMPKKAPTAKLSPAMAMKIRATANAIMKGSK